MTPPFFFPHITSIPEAGPIYGLPQIMIDDNSEIELVNDDSGLIKAVATTNASTTLSMPCTSGDVPERNTVAVTEEFTVGNKVHSLRKIDSLLSENDVRTFETASG